MNGSKKKHANFQFEKKTVQTLNCFPISKLADFKCLITATKTIYSRFESDQIFNFH